MHLHNHTEYSMLDGAAKIKPMLAEVERLGMSAVGMTDHGNMYGASEFYNVAAATGVKPIIGIEAYIAPASRFDTKRVFWGDPGQKSDDVSGSGSYTHMTMVAENATGLRNLFKLSSLASFEGQLGKWARMDADLIAEHASGIIATTGCPSGEVQTRLRLGQESEALAAAAKWQDIFGKDNFFLELMDHGLSIERRVREGLLEVGKKLGIPPLATNDCHYVTKDHAHNHEALLCVQTGKTLSDPTRFKFDGDGYYLKPASEMRDLWDDAVPGACDNTLLIAERVQSYEDVWNFKDRMPIFPVPEGEDQDSWLRKEVDRGLERRFEGVPGECPTSTSPVLTTSWTSSSKRVSPHTFSSSVTSSPTRKRSASGSALGVVRRRVHLSPTRSASPISTRYRTACCSSDSSTRNVRRRRISISTSTTAAAVRWSATPPRNGAATGSHRSSPSAPSRPRPH
ncbi:PHP domain protein [Mycobacteroides abscessus MAB_030201_1075]|uniref:PHP domain protein n=1 Tax=Mycobacteroides abscessus MAB_030201_1075 TaxID=1335410 RepID=A0A829PR60_9MYCO|nr:PHP domain protein [Mycobacteroides abscessus MAB_030201_1075]